MNFRLGLLYIIEYKESSSGPNGLDPSDTIINRIPLYSSIDPSERFTAMSELIDTEDDTKYFYYECATSSSLRGSPGPPISNLSCGMSDIRSFVTGVNKNLSPVAWNLGLLIHSYPFHGAPKSTRLAIKAVLESKGHRNVRDYIPVSGRDDPIVEMSDIMLESSSSDGIDEVDVGHISWPKLAIEQDGSYKEPSPYPVDYLTHQRQVDVLTYISSSDTVDPDTESEETLANFGNVDGETKNLHLFFISCGATQKDYLESLRRNY